MASALPPLDASEHKTIIKRHVTLAEIFSKAGYCTAAFNSNPFLTKLWSYNKGFDKFDESWGETPKFWVIREWVVEKALKAIPSKRILNLLSVIDKYADSFSFAFRGNPITSAELASSEAVSWLNSHSKNFFLWLHYMDIHAPYMPPPKYIRQFHNKSLSRYKVSALWRKSALSPTKLSNSDIDALEDLYDACIKYLDDSIGLFFDAAGNRLENTIVIITADHGDEFGEHGKTGHLTLYDGIIHVPLIIAGPDIKSIPKVEKQVRHIDLAPTIVDLAGLDKPASFNGQTLITLIRGGTDTDRPTVSVATPPGSEQEVILSYRIPNWKYIRTESVAPPKTLLSEEIYNLQHDPKEQQNLIDKETEETLRFKIEAIKAIDNFKKTKRGKLTNIEIDRIKDRVKKLKT